jgi:hypothetical protein
VRQQIQAVNAGAAVPFVAKSKSLPSPHTPASKKQRIEIDWTRLLVRMTVLPSSNVAKQPEAFPEPPGIEVGF